VIVWPAGVAKAEREQQELRDLVQKRQHEQQGSSQKASFIPICCTNV